MATNVSPKPADIRKPIHAAIKEPRPQSPLASSPAKAKREAGKLEGGRQQIESTPSAGETDIRPTVI